jgi:hypothetical protein
LDAAARGFPEFTAGAASFKNSVDHFSSLSQKITIRFSGLNSKIKTKKDNGRLISM